MTSLGPYLRQMRESKGVSLDEIARATRVGRRHLEALEAEEQDELPAPVFVKGFIRAYCGFLSTPADEALVRYRELSGEAPPLSHAAPAGRARPSRMGGPVAVSLILVLVLAGALVAVNLGLRSAPPRSLGRAPGKQAEPGPAADKARSAVAPAPSETAAAMPATPVPAAAPAAAGPVVVAEGQRLVVRAVEPTWVRVQTDHGTAVEEILPAGAVRELKSQTRFVLTVGNAAGLELTLNGQRLPPLGGRGAVIRELVLPPDASSPRS